MQVNQVEFQNIGDGGETIAKTAEQTTVVEGKIEENRRGKVGDRPDDIDIHVGNRVRSRRVMLGISQSALADALGISFQQVQKYERGTNRLSASKLFHTASFLNSPVEYFFEGLAGENIGNDNDVDGSGRMVLEIAKNLAMLSPEMKRVVNEIAKSLIVAQQLNP